MRTFKRNVNDINTSLSSYNKSVKYYNQMEWKGIVENKNAFNLDQNSQADAKNVYVNDHGNLVSRPPIQRVSLPEDVLPPNSELIDVIAYGKVKIYISNSHSPENYKIVAIGTSNAVIEDIQQYHISTVENYIICFNNKGAKVFDINNQNKGWQDLNNFVEVPIIKRVVGNEETTHDSNQFTSSYKEEYIWSNQSHPKLPSPNKRATIKVNNPVSDDTWTLDNIDRQTEYRILKKVNYNIKSLFASSSSANYISSSDAFVSMKQGIICVGTPEYVDVSFTRGNNFTRFWYPNHRTFLRIASISDDGSSYFFVASDAVYRLNFDEGTWTVIHVHDEGDKSIGTNWTTVSKGYYGSINKNQASWHFLNKDTFVFLLYTAPTEQCKAELPILWFMGPYIAGYDSIPIEKYNDIELPGGSNIEYGSPYFKSFQKIDERYRGKLGCSVALCREPYDSGTVSNDNRYGGIFEFGDSSVNTGPQYTHTSTVKSWLKIIVEDGYVREDMSFSGIASSSNTPNLGKTRSKTFATIMCGIQTSNVGNSSASVGCVAVYILPGYFCGGYVDTVGEFTEALDIKPFWNNRYVTSDNVTISKCPPLAGYIGVLGTKNWDARPDGADKSWYRPEQATIKVGPSVNSIFDNVRFESIEQISVDSLKGNGSLYSIRGKVWKGQYTNITEDNDGWYDFTWTLGRPTLSQQDTLITGPISNEINLTNQWKDIAYEGYDGNLYDITPYQSNTPMRFENSVCISDHAVYWFEEDTRIGQRITTDNWMIQNPWNCFNINVSESFPIAIEICIDRQYYLVILSNGELFTNLLGDDETASIIINYPSNKKYTDVPNVSYSNTELYLGFDNKLFITANTRDENGNILFNLPNINNQSFIENITNMINISTTEVALFFEDNIIICSKVEDQTLGYRYDYYPTKLSTGTRLGDSVINTIEGNYTIFPTKRGLAIMNYQAFMATTDQVLTYISDNIEERYDAFYAESDSIKIVQRREKLYITNGTNKILIYDISRGHWWYWETSDFHTRITNSTDKFQKNNIKKIYTDQVDLQLVCYKLYKFGEPIREYKDYENTENSDGWDSPQRIDWFIISQPMHLMAANYYKNLKQLVFHLLDNGNPHTQHTILVQIQCYRKKLSTKEPELINFKIDELRTFVKRFNYWKINEVQYALASDNETLTPTKLILNGISVKYEIGEEVR